MNNMHRNELNLRVCRWLVCGGIGEQLRQFTAAIKSLAISCASAIKRKGEYYGILFNLV